MVIGRKVECTGLGAGRWVAVVTGAQEVLAESMFSGKWEADGQQQVGCGGRCWRFEERNGKDETPLFGTESDVTRLETATEVSQSFATFAQILLKNELQRWLKLPSMDHCNLPIGPKGPPPGSRRV